MWKAFLKLFHQSRATGRTAPWRMEHVLQHLVDMIQIQKQIQYKYNKQIDGNTSETIILKSMQLLQLKINLMHIYALKIVIF